MQLNDLTGQRFGRWTVIRKDPESYKVRTLHQFTKPTTSTFSKWVCRCDCGAERSVIGANLVAGRTKSCGCLQKELLVQRTKERRKKRDG